MDEFYLDQAVQHFRVAQMIRNEMEEKVYFNFVAYYLSKAVELYLRSQFEHAGMEGPHTHDIDQMIRIGHQNHVDLHIPEYIEDHSELFSLWNLRIQYTLDYQADERKVEQAMQEVGHLLNQTTA